MLKLLLIFGAQDVYTSTSQCPFQGSKSIGVYPVLVYTCFPMICTENNKGAPSARPTGALRAPVVFVFCANHWKTGIHQKHVYTNGFDPLEGPMIGAGVYMLVPKI
jgi:hypothetical protein